MHRLCKTLKPLTEVKVTTMFCLETLCRTQMNASWPAPPTRTQAKYLMYLVTNLVTNQVHPVKSTSPVCIGCVQGHPTDSVQLLWCFCGAMSVLQSWRSHCHLEVSLPFWGVTGLVLASPWLPGPKGSLQNFAFYKMINIIQFTCQWF